MSSAENRSNTATSTTTATTNPLARTNTSQTASSARISTLQIEPCLGHASHIRNVCILAHVDHGKTTLTDSLLASNGVISHRLAGKLRYLDSRLDEQERGITMEASAITLIHTTKMGKKAKAADAPSGEGEEGQRYAINLIDSPGHVDFAGQVSSATRLCDGALLLVDAVEGVCVQTVAVMRQAWSEGLGTILCINKIDRLVCELALSEGEAEDWLCRLLEQINVAHFSVTRQDSFFDPLKGNVCFASSTDGWAFTIATFVGIYEERMPHVKQSVLQKSLWGDWRMEKGGQKIVKGRRGKGVFSALCLAPIWSVYKCTVAAWDASQIAKIIKTTAIQISEREIKRGEQRPRRDFLRQIMSRWLPIEDCVFGVIVEHIPDPLRATPDRIRKLYGAQQLQKDFIQDDAKDDAAGKSNAQGGDGHAPTLIDTICRLPPINDHDWDALPVLGFVSKLFSVTLSPYSLLCPSPIISTHASLGRPEEGGDDCCDLNIADANSNNATAQSREKLVAMTRLFHGRLAVGDTVYILHPTTTLSPSPQHTRAKITELFLMMGRDLEPVDCVWPGNVFAIGGDISSKMFPLKHCTITTDPSIPLPSSNARTPTNSSQPIISVAIRPKNIAHIPVVERGLKHLCMADPSATWQVDEDSGEYILGVAGELHLEQCMTDLQERYCMVALTVSEPMLPFRETIAAPAEDGGATSPVTDPMNTCQISVRCVPSPATSHLQPCPATLGDAEGGTRKHKILCESETDENTLMISTDIDTKTVSKYASTLTAAFHLAVKKGPLAEEPLFGCCFIVDDLKCFGGNEIGSADGGGVEEGGHSLNLLSFFKNAISAALDSAPLHLMLAQYACQIQCRADQIGRVYSVLNKRMCQISSEDYDEMTAFTTIACKLPVAESFGFSSELSQKSGGGASAQFSFCGFGVMAADPEDVLGQAYKYIVPIRERKGLFVERKIVEDAEKQRTLKR